MSIPSSLISPFRSALASQGFPMSSVDDSGNINPGALLSGAYSRVTVRSRFFPPIPLNTADLTNEPGLTKLLQPTVVFEGRFGKSIYAPYGEASEHTGWLWTTALVLSLVGLGYWLGRARRR